MSLSPPSSKTITDFRNWASQLGVMTDDSAQALIANIDEKTLQSVMSSKKRKFKEDTEEDISWDSIKELLRKLGPTTSVMLREKQTSKLLPMTPTSPASRLTTIEKLVIDIRQEQDNLSIGLLKTFAARFNLVEKLIQLLNVFQKDGKKGPVKRFEKFATQHFHLSQSFLQKNRQLYEFCLSYPRFKLASGFDNLVMNIPQLTEWFNTEECQLLSVSSFYSATFWKATVAQSHIRNMYENSNLRTHIPNPQTHPDPDIPIFSQPEVPSPFTEEDYVDYMDLDPTNQRQPKQPQPNQPQPIPTNPLRVDTTIHEYLV